MTRIGFAVSLLTLTVFATASDDELASVRDALQTCVACHGELGASPPFPQYPILAGQQYYYLYLQLRDFKSGLRKNELMAPFVQTLERDQMKLIATYFSQQSWPAIGHAADPAKVAVARAAIDSGECASCHLGDFRGASGVPRLASQHPEYLTKTMLDFKSRARNNAPDKSALLATFSEEDIESLADYFSSVTVYQGSQSAETR
ncbi:MAG: c-type cytochrome [Gammaproteobacteria bacterium]